MQKISPLKTSLEAFRKFKTNRTEVKNNNINATNPFGITFRGTVLQMDVFESTKQKENVLNDKVANVGKMFASAWLGTVNRFNTIKNNVISFGGNIYNSAKDFINKLNTTEVSFDFMKYNVMNLQNRPVAELGDMLGAELKALEV